MSPLKVFYDPPSFIFYVSNFTFLAQKPKTGPLLHSTLYSIDLKASDRAKKAADCPTAAFNFTAYRLESRRLSHCCIQIYSIDLKAPQTGPLLHSTLIFATKVTNRPTSAFNFTFLTKTKSERRCLAHCGSKTEHHGLVYWSIYYIVCTSS